MVARVLVLCALVASAGAAAAAARIAQPVYVPHGSYPHGFFALDDSTTLFFALDDSSDGYPEEIWRTDGTAAGTVALGLCPPTCTRGARFVAKGNGRAFFWAPNQQGAYELWSTDGSGSGTVRLTNFGSATLGQTLGDRSFVWLPSAGKLLFAVYESNGIGGALWASDGTIDGTHRIRRVNAGEPVVVGDAAYFLAGEPGGSTLDLWRTDATPLGTTQVAGPFQRTVHGMVAAGDRLVLVDTTYVAQSQRYTFRVWGSDGTAAGTQVIREFPGWFLVNPGAELVAVGTDAFIKLPTYPAAELWRSDGTAAGTALVPLPAGVGATSLPVLGPHGTFYLSARDSTHGMELWRSDGTPAGTALVADLCPGDCDSVPMPTQAVGHRMLFFAGNFLTGSSLYDTDGSDVRLLIRALTGGTTGPEVVAGDRVFLPTSSDTEGIELWTADLRTGTSAALTHFTPRQAINLPLAAGAVGDRILFAADDGPHGTELWRSDGTPAGTHLLGDLVPDDVPQAAPATPTHLTVVPVNAGAFQITWDEVPGAMGYVMETRTPFGDGTSVAVPDTLHWVTGVGPGTPITVRVRATNSAGSSPYTDEVSATTSDPEPPARCEPAADSLCLSGSRFRVQVRWRNVHAAPGATSQGHGEVIPAGNGSEVSGYFWFFSPDNVELVVKMLDGTSINGFNWFFYGALSDVEYWITVLDTLTQESRTYHNTPGNYCGKADVRSLATSAAAAAPSSAWSGAAFDVGTGASTGPPAVAASGTCVENDTTLCLGDGRFRVEVEWNAPNLGRQGVGHAVPFRDPTGFFWFFDASNTELVVKLLDGRPVNGKYWFFYGALSDVGYTITVTDTLDPTKARHYVNPPGTFCGRADVDAF
jgi:ELWxxDGT repeat protein